MRQRTAAFVGGGVALAAVLAIIGYSLRGGDTIYACPAIGRASDLSVRITGDASAVHDVRLCTTGGCSAPAAGTPTGSATGSPSGSMGGSPSGPETGPASTTQENTMTGETIPAAPTGPETPSPELPTAATHFAAPHSVTIVGTPPRSWAFETGAAYPTEVTATAYGSDGRRLATRSAHLEWHREYPENVCETWSVTDAVRLHVGS